MRSPDRDGCVTMDGTKWLEITLPCARAELDGVCAQLTMNGVTGLEIEDEEDFHAFLENNRQYWDYVDASLEAKMTGLCQVKLYVTDDTDGQAALRRYLAGLEDREYAVRPLLENDWATSWQKYYKPFPVGEKLYVVPQWLRSEAVPAGRTAVYLNPGLTFGTGNHTSTQLCMEGLERAVKPGDRVLDLGCGSGILAIAALLLGAKSSVGVDIDPKAADVAYENAAFNGIGQERLLTLAGDVLSDRRLVKRLWETQFQIVLANIVADVIIPLSAYAEKFLAPGGLFLCSGVIDTRADEVDAALRFNGFAVTERRERDGWVAFTAMRA